MDRWIDKDPRKSNEEPADKLPMQSESNERKMTGEE